MKLPRKSFTAPTPTRITLVACAVFVLVQSGCVRRRLTIRTNPAGAMAYVGKQPVGRTPISTDLTYYGKREIEVVADNYRTERVVRNLAPPWYQIPPLDFISETLWPWEIRDERVVDIQMVPYQAPASEVLQARADGFRLQASQGVATPIPNIAPGATGSLPGLGAPAAEIPVAPDFTPDLSPSDFPVGPAQPPFGDTR